MGYGSCLTVVAVGLGTPAGVGVGTGGGLSAPHAIAMTATTHNMTDVAAAFIGIDLRHDKQQTAVVGPSTSLRYMPTTCQGYI